MPSTPPAVTSETAPAVTKQPSRLARLVHQGKCLWLTLRGDVRQYYTILAEEEIRSLERNKTVPTRPMWLNLGYWEHATTHPDACAALAHRLGDAAALRHDDCVLDVGCGYAEPDIYWVRAFDVARIVAINVTPLHTGIARQLVEHHGLRRRIHVQLASAVSLPYTSNCFDAVLALECAFHFNTRERFFGEAHRVLRSGGRLAIADMLPLPGRPWNGLRRRLNRRTIALPEANMYDRVEYRPGCAPPASPTSPCSPSRGMSTRRLPDAWRSGRRGAPTSTRSSCA